MTFLFALLTRTGLSERIARLLSYVIPALVVIVAVSLLVRCAVDQIEDGKSEAVQLNIAEASAEANARVLEADRATMANQMTRDAAIATERMEAQREADKVSTDEPVGPGVKSGIERMREQQEAARSR